MDTLKRVILVTLLFSALNSNAKPEVCARWLVNGEDVTEGSSISRVVRSRFVNVRIPGTADLRRPFVYLMVEGRRSLVDLESDLVEAFDTTKQYLQTIISRASVNDPTMGSSKDQVIQGLVWNTEIGNMTDVQINLGFVRRTLARTLDYLYSIYATQPLRSPNLSKYHDQDLRKAQRTVRFTKLVNGQVISHAQVEISRTRRQQLNFQEVLEEVRGLEIKANEVIGEFERLEVIRENDLQPDTRDYKRALGLDRDLLFFRTMQKPLSWMNHDVQLNRLFYYCSRGMSRLLESSIPKLKNVKKYEVRAKGSNINEVLYDLKREDLLVIEEYLMTKIIEHHFRVDLPVLKAVKDEGRNFSWKFNFWPNEFAVLQRMEISDLSLYSMATLYVRDAFRRYFAYRKDHDIIPQLADFFDEAMSPFRSIKDSLLLTLDGIHALQLEDISGFSLDSVATPATNRRSHSSP